MHESNRRLRAWAGTAAVAAFLAAGCVPATAGAADHGAPKPDPTPLWNAYPLDGDNASAQATTPTTSTPAAPPKTTQTVPVSNAAAPVATTRDTAGDGPPWALIVLAALLGVLFVVVLLRLQRRMEARREEALPPPADDWPLVNLMPAPDDRPRPGTASTAAKSGPAFEVPELISVPVRRFEPVAEAAPEPAAREAEPAAPKPGRFERAPVDWGEDRPHRGRFDREPPAEPAQPPTSQERAAAARRGPICQVRWSSRGTRFYAVTTDKDGVEHPLARSPQVAWEGLGPPPEDNREAQAALRLLAKELRESGWRPMRAKGVDFETQQWYARRFRFPVAEGEDARTPWRPAPDAAAAERRRA